MVDIGRPAVPAGAWPQAPGKSPGFQRGAARPDGEQGCWEAQAGRGTQSRAQRGAHLLGSAQFLPLGPRHVSRCKQRESESWPGRRGRCQGTGGRKWERCDMIVRYLQGTVGARGRISPPNRSGPGLSAWDAGLRPAVPDPSPPHRGDSGTWERGCGTIPPGPPKASGPSWGLNCSVLGLSSRT